MGASCGRDAPIAYEVQTLLEERCPAPLAACCCSGGAKLRVVPLDEAGACAFDGLPPEEATEAGCRQEVQTLLEERCPAPLAACCCSGGAKLRVVPLDEAGACAFDGLPPEAATEAGCRQEAPAEGGGAPKEGGGAPGDAAGLSARATEAVSESPVAASDGAGRGEEQAAAVDSEPRQPRRPADPSSAFVAFLTFAEGAGKLGMAVDVTRSGFLRVSGVEESGPVAFYNMSAPTHALIREGDMITSVNGLEGDAQKQFLALQAGGLIELGVCRPLLFTVGGLDISGGRVLGLDVVYHETSTAAYIIGVREGGLVHAHNQATLEARVREGDLIVAVNGQRGSASELLQMMGSTNAFGFEEEDEELELTVARPWEPLNGVPPGAPHC